MSSNAIIGNSSSMLTALVMAVHGENDCKTSKEISKYIQGKKKSDHVKTLTKIISDCLNDSCQCGLCSQIKDAGVNASRQLSSKQASK